ncbi:MAG TPA: ABC-type transport auxiliary lipoprotein family protein [Steroidobacteraceae bacterium]|nr:ABC-type transport auxiliary lipoprotein family protein [Steroidobacteraceae bacterium]
MSLLNSNRGRFAPWAAASLAAVCTGCVGGAFDSEQLPQHVYVLSPLPASSSEGGPLPVGLTVARPSARPGLDTDRIALLQPDRRLDYFAAARWGAEAQTVVQDLLIQSLRNTGRLATVQGDLSPFLSDYVLQTDLVAFQAEYTSGANPVVRVSMVCTVGRVRDRRPLADFTATATAPASSNTLSATVEAFESAYQQAAKVAVTETLNALAAASAAAPPSAAGH